MDHHLNAEGVNHWNEGQVNHNVAFGNGNARKRSNVAKKRNNTSNVPYFFAKGPVIKISNIKKAQVSRLFRDNTLNIDTDFYSENDISNMKALIQRRMEDGAYRMK